MLRARSERNAVGAKTAVLSRGERTGHWCGPQHGSSVEFTGRGQWVLSLRLRQWLLLGLG